MPLQELGRDMQEQLICEPIQPVAGTMDTGGMTRGDPGLPGQFIWRGDEYAVQEVLERWRETSPCRSGAAERYVRKHWFRIKTADGKEMKIYFERQPRSRRQSTLRWWISRILNPES